MAPDFSKAVAETLAKRAASMCSNGDCRTLTSGPSVVAEKAISVGEAAHIFGAKSGSARFRGDMTDTSRAEITNGIWLCRNCHKLVDSDPVRFTADLLFAWRDQHEKYVISKLGSSAEKIRVEIEGNRIEFLRHDSSLARQIALDRDGGWEYRLTAELLREYLRKPLRRWRDLQASLYARQTEIILDEECIPWFGARNEEAGRFVNALAALYTSELSKAWGAPGHPGDAAEIKHVCSLIKSTAEQMVEWEERVRFVGVSRDYSELFECLPGIVGSQLQRLSEIPHQLDSAVDWAIANQGVARKFDYELVFELPDGWSRRVSKALKRVTKGKSWLSLW